MKPLDISVIILTYNEEIHLSRCLENSKLFAKNIFVVDSFSTDRTREIAEEFDVSFVQHQWENNYAKQFNWALRHLPIKTQWIVRLDADEYLMQELINELQARLPLIEPDINGIVWKRRHYFLGRWMKHGVYPVKLLRLFRTGKGTCEQRLMDEHIQLSDGMCIEFEHDFVDHNLNDLSWFCHKHVNYAVREAADLLDIELNLFGNSHHDAEKILGGQASQKRGKKHRYVRMPLFWRALAYFLYRYFLRGGVMEGAEGFLWNFLQGLWYRTLVDAKIYEIKKSCGNDSQKIKTLLVEKYKLALH